MRKRQRCREKTIEEVEGGKSEKAKRRWRKFGRRNKKKENDIKNNLRYENYQNIINGKNTV